MVVSSAVSRSLNLFILLLKYFGCIAVLSWNENASLRLANYNYIFIVEKEAVPYTIAPFDFIGVFMNLTCDKSLNVYMLSFLLFSYYWNSGLLIILSLLFTYTYE